MCTLAGAEIAALQAEGKLVPSEITVELIRNAIEEARGAPGYLIDGFPRNVTQADMFEDHICRAEAIINLAASEAAMTKRILARAKVRSCRTIASLLRSRIVGARRAAVRTTTSRRSRSALRRTASTASRSLPSTPKSTVC